MRRLRSSRRARALALGALLLAAAPRAAPGAARAAAHPDPGETQPATDAPVRHLTGFGAVLHVTTERAYLDVGAADGLAPGQTLRLFRGPEQVGSCEVEAVADRHATCLSLDHPRRGDTFRLGARPPGPAVKVLPRLVAPEELDRRAEVVAAEAFPKVEAKAKPADAALEARARRVEASLSHAAWASSGARAWNEERVDLTIQGVDTFAGLKLYGDARAVRWTTRPDTARDRPTERTRLYVWEAALAARDPSRPYTLAFGRVLPFGIPGATTFDGAQVGLVPAGRRGEVGLFGGLVPNPATTSPATDRSTAGAYATFDLGEGWLVTREDLRAAISTSPELGTRFEGEARSYVLIGRKVNAGADLRVGYGGRRQAQGGIDLAQVDLSGRPLPRVVLSGLFRYAGLSVPDAAAPALFPGPERRWDGSVGYEVGPAVVSAAGGLGRDLSTGLERWWVGPEVGVPRLFGARGGASFGYAEERGWLAGRTAWAQAVLRAGQTVRLTSRLTYTADSRPGAAGDDHAVGVSCAATADLASWASVRASVLARIGARGIDAVDPAGGVAALAGLELRR